MVKEMLGNELFDRCRDSFMGPIIKVGERKLQFSAKIAHCIFTRHLLTVKKNELWFHFAAQPMRFSIREFHMVTWLKCGEETPVNTKRKMLKFSNRLLNRSHTLNELEEELLKFRKDKVEERFALGMLLLIEAIFLSKYHGCKFSAENVERAHDLESLMNYPWGRDAYTVLLKSIKKVLNFDMSGTKYDLHEFPLAIHLWVLASVPLLQSTFSRFEKNPANTTWVCLRFLETDSPKIASIRSVEASPNVSIIKMLECHSLDLKDMSKIDDEYAHDMRIKLACDIFEEFEDTMET